MTFPTVNGTTNSPQLPHKWYECLIIDQLHRHFSASPFGLGSLFMGRYKTLSWNYVQQWTYRNTDELQTNACYYRIKMNSQITNDMNVWLSISCPRVPDVTLCHCHSVTQCHVLSCQSSAIIPLSPQYRYPGNYFELCRDCTQHIIANFDE